MKEYFDARDSHRPTKERERLNVCCEGSGSYFDGLCTSLETIAHSLDERVKSREVEEVVISMVEECPDKMEHYGKVYPDDVERPELVDEFKVDAASIDDIDR